MSATIHKLPEPTYRPNFEGLFKVIDQRPDDSAYLIGLAELDIGLVTDFQDKGTPDDDATPAECQKITNALALAWVALGEALGIPRDMIIGDEDLPGGAA
jgi:hypothetical protein